MGSLKTDEDDLVISGSVDESKQEAIIYVNGVRRILPNGLAHFTLLEYLGDIGLTGTKLVCGEGGCGACTVMVSYFDQLSKKTIHSAVNACLTPLYSVEGMHVITVEGIGNRRQGLHPIQETMARSHGSQCGFCTPGFIMSMYALLRSNRGCPSEEQIEESLGGNLCRCTGYRPIIDAFRVFAKTDNVLYIDNGKPCSSESPSGSEFICPSTGNMFLWNEDGSSYREKEHIFPPELLLRKLKPLSLTGFGGIKWYRALRLQHVLDLKSKYPDAKLVIGNTEVGIEMKLKGLKYQALVSVAHVPELNNLNVKDDGLEIGAAIRLSELHKFLKKVSAERAAHETSASRAFIEQIKWFAGKQTRNVASVGGNICTASPISDLNPLWMAAGARFQVIDCSGNIRTVNAKDFFLGYHKVDLASNEILLSIFLPWTRQYEYVKEFKQAHRREDDIALVNAGMRVFLEKTSEGSWAVADASIVYGGVAPVSLSASKTEMLLAGKFWGQGLIQDALREDIVIKDGAPGGMVEFRRLLTLSFFFKFCLWVSHQMEGEQSFKETVPLSYLSAVQSFSRPFPTASQNYDITKLGTAVGLPEIHLSSRLQVTGDAEYVDDTATPPECLHAALILSRKPHARIVSIDDSEAKSSPGFAGLFLAKYLPGDNTIGPVVHDEELFASEFVTCVGQLIGVVVADTHDNAKLAARKVHVEYEELPSVLSIKDALKSNSYHPNTERFMIKGDVELCFKSGECDKIIEGEVHIGGQEHFYFETQGTLVWTLDGGNEVHMISSTQAIQKHQIYVSHVLGLPMSKVVCKTKRIGGGFGGKETRSAIIAAAASVPSYLLNRPVKLILDRDVDMMITGQRHSFLGKYKVGFTNEGRMLGLDLEIYNNAGNSLDLSLSILERAMFHSDNVYDIPNMRVRGRVCYTNMPSNTAFRGFGGPQGMLVAENWIQRVAMELKKSPEGIREINFQKEGYVLHYGQELQNFTVPRIWDELKSSFDFIEARKESDQFNLQNRWKKRGIAMIPTKFGISFTLKFMNQAGALVQVYTDGTVLVTHEYRQVPNSSPTAASASSDMYGAAVLDACEQIKAWMEPIASRNKHNSFAELALACYFERIDLSAHGFYRTPDIGFDWNTGKGAPYSYFTYGASFAEVEIDTLTGDFHTRTADIIMDLGHSINPAIDIGQIEGSFVQGLGWVALEELKWGDADHKWIPPSHLYTCGPGTYKLPSVDDIPLIFNVSLVKDAPNPKAIHSSKAVGEPPFFLATSIFFAIKDAITAARAEVGLNEWFPLDNPATPERIRMACADDLTKPFAGPDYRPKLSM
ncbi:hypothetical protein C5167_001722 [Papaver somniferum]|uniref:Xanthine dehydrogenase n=1 Tax=Papaver somniferum TaxID=3469 RepID=A0A4Y7KYN2_PAPSO|nr:hypothetical protein C5167_001722 [Papaver somniferum]